MCPVDSAMPRRPAPGNVTARHESRDAAEVTATLRVLELHGAASRVPGALLTSVAPAVVGAVVDAVVGRNEHRQMPSQSKSGASETL